MFCICCINIRNNCNTYSNNCIYLKVKIVIKWFLIKMTLRQYYDNLPRLKQFTFRDKWLSISKKNRCTFCNMLKNATERDIRLLSEITGVEANEVYKPIEVKLNIFSSKRTKYRKAV